jgi:glycosyltransferase involved in cell wall biosynthesis
VKRADLKLLVLTDELEVGGTQRQIATLVKHLPAVGVRPVVGYFLKRSYLADEMIAAGCPVVQVARHGRLDPTFPLRLARLIRGQRPDVLHCVALSAEFWGLIAHVLAGRRAAFVSSIRGRYEWYAPLQWRVKAVISRFSDCVVANAAAGANYAIERGGVPESKVVIVPNGLDLEEFDRAAAAGWPPELASLPAGQRLIFVGRLVDHKNVPCLLRAMAELRRLQVPAQLCVVGDGPLRASLARLAADLGIQDNVHWLGERDDIPAILAGADCLLLSSHREGLSNAILEGMAAGLPVVATAVGGNVELVKDAETGWLVQDDDHMALAARAAALLADADLRRRLGAAARRRVAEQYSEAMMVARMAEIYHDVAGRRRHEDGR